MLAAVTNAKRMDWAGWWLGIMRSFISGAAGAVTATGIVGFSDPKDWGTGNPVHMLTLAGATLAGTGFIHMMIFLQTHPTPDPVSNGALPAPVSNGAAPAAPTLPVAPAGASAVPPQPNPSAAPPADPPSPWTANK